MQKLLSSNDVIDTNKIKCRDDNEVIIEKIFID